MNQELNTSSQKAYLETVVHKLDEISLAMEKLGIAEYVDLLHNPRRLFFINFWSGLIRGFGMAIGFTLLAAVVLYVLQQIVVLNTPVIGSFIAEIVNIVQKQLDVRGSI
ncbi:MAG: DUF5665 domain-containing protein [Syntrophomonadaceae bacterium]|nr:DUF5665 domain-containing protein [Syntrophomonadaceae bacterium]